MSVQIPARPQTPIAVGLSQCLAGNAVRYDGSDGRDALPHQQLQGLFEFQTFCPEVGIGLSVPRAPIRLVGTVDDYRVVGVNDPKFDKTDELIVYARQQIPHIAELSGYIFMHHSPSCGLADVKLYPAQGGKPQRQARGIFADGIVKSLPDMPVQDGNRLFDEGALENFVMRAYTYAHWQLCRPNLSAARLIEFHSRYKYLLMAHSVTGYQQAGRLLSNVQDDLEAKAGAYISLLMSKLSEVADRRGHANVMFHLQGYLKQALDTLQTQKLRGAIEAYRVGELPRATPLSLLRQYFTEYPNEYVLRQAYLQPYPDSWLVGARI